MGTLDRPTRGRVLLDGTDVQEQSDAGLAALRLDLLERRVPGGSP